MWMAFRCKGKSGFIRQRTMMFNAVHAHLAEFGIITTWSCFAKVESTY